MSGWHNGSLLQCQVACLSQLVCKQASTCFSSEAGQPSASTADAKCNIAFGPKPCTCLGGMSSATGGTCNTTLCPPACRYGSYHLVRYEGSPSIGWLYGGERCREGLLRVVPAPARVMAPPPA